MSNNFVDNDNMTALMTAVGNKLNAKVEGHTIQNESGADLTQRDTMQFTGQAKATDDSTNGKTIIDVSPEVIDWDDWRQMTDQEKEAIPEAMIENAPGVDGTLTANLFNKLWENPDPTSDFAAQPVTLSSDDYDFLLLNYRFTTTARSQKSVMWDKSTDGAILEVAYTTGSVPLNVFRTVAVSNGTTVTFSSAANVRHDQTSQVTQNNYLIPLAIYGIKKTINLEFSAIASDVSTSADKCMLSDEVTSVEDVIDNLGTASTKSYTTTITQSSSDLPTAGAVYSYVDTMITQALTGSY